MKQKHLRVTAFTSVGAVLVLLTGCSGESNPIPASGIQLHAENSSLSNFTWISADLNLIPLNNGEAAIDSVIIDVGIDVPECGYMGGVELSAYSKGTLVWDKTGLQKIVFAQPIPLLSKKIEVKPDARVVIARGNAYVELVYGIMVGTTKESADKNSYCEYLPMPGFDPVNPALIDVEERWSQGILRIDIPSGNEDFIPIASNASKSTPTSPNPQLVPTPLRPTARPTALPTKSPPPNPPIVPTPIGPTSGNPTLTLNQRSNCREGPSTAYEVVYSFEADTQFEIIGTHGSGWWLVPIDLDFTRKKSCWIYEEGNTIFGDVNNVPQVQPSPLPPTEAPPSSADLPIYDFYSNSLIGYMTCSEASQYEYWDSELLSDQVTIVYYSTIELYGSTFAGYYEQDGKTICGW